MANKNLREKYIIKIDVIKAKLSLLASKIQYVLEDDDKVLIDLIEDSIKDI